MKRILCLLCILLLTAGLFAACGKPEPPAPPTSSYDEPAGTEPETLPADPSGNDEINIGEAFTELAEAFSQLEQVFSATWPENEFTKQMPRPKFETGLGVSEAGTFGILTSATVDQLRDYTKDLKNAGFTRNASSTDESVLGLTVYTYEADNGRGYRVEIAYSMGMSAITIKKI